MVLGYMPLSKSKHMSWLHKLWASCEMCNLDLWCQMHYIYSNFSLIVYSTYTHLCNAHLFAHKICTPMISKVMLHKICYTPISTHLVFYNVIINFDVHQLSIDRQVDNINFYFLKISLVDTNFSRERVMDARWGLRGGGHRTWCGG
jgi:hypothetical protein